MSFRDSLQVISADLKIWFIPLFCGASYPFKPACVTCSDICHPITTSENLQKDRARQAIVRAASSGRNSTKN